MMADVSNVAGNVLSGTFNLLKEAGKNTGNTCDFLIATSCASLLAGRVCDFTGINPRLPLEKYGNTLFNITDFWLNKDSIQGIYDICSSVWHMPSRGIEGIKKVCFVTAKFLSNGFQLFGALQATGVITGISKDSISLYGSIAGAAYRGSEVISAIQNPNTIPFHKTVQSAALLGIKLMKLLAFGARGSTVGRFVIKYSNDLELAFITVYTAAMIFSHSKKNAAGNKKKD